MNEKDIVFNWLERHGDELPTIVYPKEVIVFIKTSAEVHNDIFYNVNGMWQKIAEQ